MCCSDGNFVDAELVQHLYVLLHRLLESGVDRVELDLRSVHCVDTKLLASLVTALGVARRTSTQLVIHIPPAMQDLVQICRLQQVFSVSKCGAFSDLPLVKRRSVLPRAHEPAA